MGGVSVDFEALLRESREHGAQRRARRPVPSGTPVFGEWPEQGVAFDVRRGSFVIPPELFDEGREHELARFFARSIPDEAETGRREKLRGGAVRIHWRIVRVVAA